MVSRWSVGRCLVDHLLTTYQPLFLCRSVRRFNYEHQSKYKHSRLYAAKVSILIRCKPFRIRNSTHLTISFMPTYPFILVSVSITPPSYITKGTTNLNIWTGISSIDTLNIFMFTLGKINLMSHAAVALVVHQFRA